MKAPFFCFVFILRCATVSFAQSPDWKACADSSQQALQTQFFDDARHYYRHDNHGNAQFDYWWNAHAIDVLTDGYIRTRDTLYLQRIDQTLQGIYEQNGRKWFNEFYDDMEWLTIALLRAYEASGREGYHTLAKTLWRKIQTGWTNAGGGGIMWARHSPFSKNACSNGPAIIIAARFHRIGKRPEDLQLAKRIFQWQKEHLIDPVNGTVYDALSAKGDSIQINKNPNWIFTYNQGTWIGGGLELYRLTGDRQYLMPVLRTAAFVISDTARFSPQGVLRGERTGDGGLFKGIFVRYLTELICYGGLERAEEERYARFLVANGESLYRQGIRRPAYTFDPAWRRMPATSEQDCSVQLSGAMLFESLALLAANGLLPK
ncbi:glycoside hydrolase family 76 protein [Chitinophaga lutea]